MDEQMIELIARAIGEAERSACGGYPSTTDADPKWNPWLTDKHREAARAAHSVIAGKVAELEGANANLVTAEHRAVMANVRVGKWLSAALDDANVCEEMKADILEWFSAGHPPHALSAALAPYPERRSE